MSLILPVKPRGSVSGGDATCGFLIRGTKCAVILALGVVTLARTEARTRDDEDRVRDAAKSKYEHVLTSVAPGDPLADVLPRLFCKTVHRVELPDVCGADTNRARVYLVDVLPTNSAPIYDVFVVADESTVYSLREDGSMQRLLDDHHAVCLSATDLRALASIHLRLMYRPSERDWLPPEMCEGSSSPAEGPECIPPSVHSAGRVLTLALRARVSGATVGDVHDKWVTWRFELDGGTYRAVRLDAVRDCESR